MRTNFIYYRNDIEKWLVENYPRIKPGNTLKEYADNSVRYHNSKDCWKHCPCENENHEIISPRLAVQDKKWFKEVVTDLLDDIWKQNTYLGILRR